MAQIDILHDIIRTDFRSSSRFSLQDVYSAALPEWDLRFPNNTAPEASIRKLLQKLRDRGDIEFLGDNGTYRLRS